MKNIERISNNIFTSVTVLLIALILWFAIIERSLPRNFTEEIQQLSGFHYVLNSGETNEITLPYRFEKLSARTPITLYTQVTAPSNQCLLLKTVYSPLRLYADDVLIYECGQDGSYSAFLLDPPTIINIVSLPQKSTPQNLRFEFLSPAQRNTLLIPKILVGGDEALLMHLSKENGFTFTPNDDWFGVDCGGTDFCTHRGGVNALYVAGTFFFGKRGVVAWRM